MANPLIQTVIEAIETQLDTAVTSGTLSFMNGEPDPVEVFDKRPENDSVRNYKRYKIMLYPDPDEAFREVPKIGGNVDRFYNIGITVFRKVPRKRKWLIFSDSDAIVGGAGVYEVVNLVMALLRNSTLGGIVNVNVASQFSTPVMEDTDDPMFSRIDFSYMCESLQSISSGIT